ncbi:cobalamin B12-binding domain-containing protein [Mangrovibacillus cuniculi]|uniref:Cobalamin-binding protein n=1 Tax=Mangrovibacillus cuniculi TaxID=2593652 RepID=A0A7S8HEI1_9BACI|nr:cobalamin-dependent protein [Mangrovibacillus cuniculi]QPC45742.1 cobalamin-binding protein [Mangrovibacillus cuniculi]
MQSMITHATDTMLEGNTSKLISIVEECRKLGWSNLTIFEELLKPALYTVGDKWESDEVTVADEHLATMTVDYILSFLQKAEDSQTKIERTAMLFCVEGEEHYLGLKMTASILSLSGWEVKFLGPNLPTKYAVHFAKKWKPQLIGISVSMRGLIKNVEECTSELASLSHRPSIFVGGRIVALKEKMMLPRNVERITSLYDLQHWLTHKNMQDTSFQKEVTLR